MRRVAIVMVTVAVGLGIAVAVVLLAPRLDPRWRSVTTRDASIAQRLTGDAPAPLLFVPGSVTRDPAPDVTLVVVLPGLGGAGRDLAEQFVGVAEDERWLLLAPSPSYDPVDANESLLAADLRVDNELVTLVGEVMAGSSLHVAPLIDLVGFSRGAQSAHRFTLRHPERVAALASFSAGTYTMPTSAQPYPLGMGGFDTWNHLRTFDAASLRGVRVLVGVGTADANPADVARAWDSVGGTSRLERATRFAAALEQLQVPARLQTYAGVGHSFVPAMRADAIELFRSSVPDHGS